MRSARNLVDLACSSAAEASWAGVSSRIGQAAPSCAGHFRRSHFLQSSALPLSQLRAPAEPSQVPGVALKACGATALPLHLSIRRRFHGASQHLDRPRKESGSAEDVTVRDDPFSDVSTKVTPVTTPEAASWSVLIVAAYAMTAALLYMVVTNIFIQTPESAAFEAALDVVRSDFRVILRLGESIKGYGGAGGTTNRKARHNISHRLYEDSAGKQHVQVQFNISGNGTRGVVSADMFKDGGQWQTAYLYADIAGERIVVKAP